MLNYRLNAVFPVRERLFICVFIKSVEVNGADGSIRNSKGSAPKDSRATPFKSRFFRLAVVAVSIAGACAPTATH